jgi:hypothetical protein
MGRDVSELVTYGEYREMDLSPFSYSRLERGERLVERAVITRSPLERRSDVSG